MMYHSFNSSNGFALKKSLFPVKTKIIFAVFASIIISICGCTGPTEETYREASPAEGLVRIAEQLYSRGDLAGASDFYQRALNHDPNNFQARKRIAEIMEKTGREDLAVEEYRALAKLKPRDSEIYRNLGRVLLALEKPAEAREAYMKALSITDDDAKAINGLAIALDRMGEHEAAQKRYEAALKIEPENIVTINNLAYSKILLGDYEEAIRLLEPHLKNPKATSALRQNLALAYGLAGMMIDAERVAKMDLPPHKVTEALDYYRRKRAEIAVDTTPYAEIGSYATEALAEAEIDRLQSHMEKTGVDLNPVITPQVSAPGGTPRFTVRMLGCVKPDDVKVFCDQLARHNIPCAVRGYGKSKGKN